MSTLRSPALRLMMLALLPVFLTAGDSPVVSLVELKAPIAISPVYAGFNNQTGGTPHPWSQPIRRQAISIAAPASFRIPGGTISTYWDMRNDQVFKSGPVVDAAKDVVINDGFIIGWMRQLAHNPQPNPLEDLARGMEVFADPADAPEFIFVTNITTPGHDYYESLWGRPVDPTPLSNDWWTMLKDRFERNIDAIDRARALGLNVNRIELGNEFYFGISAEPYISGGQQFEQKARGQRVFSGSYITGAFPSLGESYAYAANDWAKKLKERYPGVEVAATGGDTTKPGQSDRRRLWNINVVSKFDPELIDAMTLHIYTPVPADLAEFSGPAKLGHWGAYWIQHWHEVQELSAIPEDIPVWLSEWDNGFQRYPRDWAHALMGSFTLSQFLATGQVRVTSYHQFAGSFTADGLHPIATVIGQWALASRGATSAREMVFGGEAMLPSSLSPATRGGLSSLIGWQFTGEGLSPRYLLTNLSDLPVDLDVSTWSGDLSSLTTTASNNLDATSPVEPSVKSVDGAITLPPYSVSVLH